MIADLQLRVTRSPSVSSNTGRPSMSTAESVRSAARRAVGLFLRPFSFLCLLTTLGQDGSGAAGGGTPSGAAAVGRVWWVYNNLLSFTSCDECLFLVILIVLLNFSVCSGNGLLVLAPIMTGRLQRRTGKLSSSTIAFAILQTGETV
jgi:hypothetical protein